MEIKFSKYFQHPSLLRYVVAIIIGLIYGYLIYVESAMLFTDYKESPSFLFIFVTIIGGWVLTSFLMVRGAKSTIKVLQRGFLIGAALWFLMIPVASIFTGAAIIMFIICISGYFLTYILDRRISHK